MLPLRFGVVCKAAVATITLALTTQIASLTALMCPMKRNLITNLITNSSSSRTSPLLRNTAATINPSTTQVVRSVAWIPAKPKR